MRRKKQPIAQASDTKTNDAELLTLEQPAGSAEETEVIPAMTEGDEPEETSDSKWRRNFDSISVGPAGIYFGEDRRFNQVYIQFNDDHKPTDEQKKKMRDAGFRYRSADKRWDAPASRTNRLAGERLVTEFTGITLGAGRGA